MNEAARAGANANGGNIVEHRCQACGRHTDIAPLLEQARRDALAPVCALIDGQDIVWYGSEQWLQRLRAAAAASHQEATERYEGPYCGCHPLPDDLPSPDTEGGADRG